MSKRSIRYATQITVTPEVEDISWKNVNGGKATRAILGQVIRTKRQAAGPIKGPDQEEEQTQEVKSRAETHQGGCSWVSEEWIRRGRGSGKILEDSEWKRTRDRVSIDNDS